MKVLVLYVFFSLVLLCCTPVHPNKARASQLFSEVNQIAQESKDRRQGDELLTTMKRLNETKKDFPNNREEIAKDSELVKSFFVREMEDDRQIIQRYQELLTLGLAKPEADCIELGIKLQGAMIERADFAVNELDLVNDDSIRDNDTFKSRTAAVREKGNQIEKKQADIKTEMGNLCSKSKLGIN